MRPNWSALSVASVVGFQVISASSGLSLAFSSAAFEVARAALHRALDVVVRQVLLARLVDREAQAWIAAGIAAAQARRNGDLTGQAREDLAALRIRALLAVLDVGPSAVAGHGA